MRLFEVRAELFTRRSTPGAGFGGLRISSLRQEKHRFQVKVWEAVASPLPSAWVVSKRGDVELPERPLLGSVPG